MKRSILATVAAALIACADSLPPLTDGHAVGYYDGQSWIANVFAAVSKRAGEADTLVVTATRPGNASRLDEQVSFKIELKGVGEYPVPKRGTGLWLMVGGDGVVAKFVGQSDPAGRLTIVRADASTVEGTFNLALVPYATVGGGDNRVRRFERVRFRTRPSIFQH